MGAVMLDMVPFAGWTLIPQRAFLEHDWKNSVNSQIGACWLSFEFLLSNLICLIEWITWYIKLKIKLVIGKAFARNCKQAQTLLPNWVVRVLGGRRPHLVPALLLKQEDKLTETRHENITDGSKCPLAVKVSNKEGNRRPGGLNVSGTVSVDSLHERSRLSLARRVSLFPNFNIPQVRVEIFHSWLGCAKIW